MALLSTAAGASTITETIFEQRFWHVDELRKMGPTSPCEARLRWCAAYLAYEVQWSRAPMCGLPRPY